MALFSFITRPFLYSWEDFMEQSLFMKACIAWGWLAIAIMLASLIPTLPAVYGELTR